MATTNPYPQGPYGPQQPQPGYPQGQMPMGQPGQMPRPIPLGPGAARPIPVPKGTAKPADKKGQGQNGEEEQQPPLPEAVKNAPPWLISAVIHIVLLIILALIYSVEIIKTELVVLDANWDEKEGEQLENEEFEMKVEEPTDATEAVLENKPVVDDPFAAPPEMEVVDVTGMTAVSNIKAPSIGMALNGREDGMKQALLSRYGGNPQGEKAVMLALEWLARVQDPHTGAWSLTGKQNNCKFSNGSERENMSAATAMALLAFQGAGHTHTKGKFKKNVAKGWEFLLKQQTPDGCMSDVDSRELFYTHGQCTIAVCEMYGMTKDPKFQEPAKKAVEFCVKTQHRLGGWRYHIGEGGMSTDSDTSVSGWLVMGLQSAKMARMDVPKDTMDGIGRYLDKAQKNGGSHYGYQADGSESEVMTAEGLLCRQYLGWKQDDRRMTAGADYLLTKLPTYSDRNVYYWYYATQVMHHLEGNRWTKWNGVMRDLLISKQEQAGTEKGSWDPIKPTPDKWGIEAGRLYTTCLSTYILEVYYRHLPIYGKMAL